MPKLHTVRLSYIYIFAGTALLSGVFVYGVREAIMLLYSHYYGRPDAWIIRAIHWGINHIGQIPAALLLFSAVFTGLYLLRSQKIAGDLRTLVTGTTEWADTGTCPGFEVLSGGELGLIADNLSRIQEKPAGSAQEESDYIALLVKTRAILLVLREAAEGEHDTGHRQGLEAVRSELRSMERFLENRIISP